MRLTNKVRQQLLDQNQGFETTTHYSGKNLTEDRKYIVFGGELHIRAKGNGSWADSYYDEESVADEHQTRRLLSTYLHALNTDGLE